MTAAPLTIAAGAVAADLAGFVMRVQLADLPASWWEVVAPDGGNIRAHRAGTPLPVDVAWIDPATRTGEAFVRVDLLPAADATTVVVDAVEGAPALDVADPLGRHAVWADYDYFMHGIAPGVDRSGKTTATAIGNVSTGSISGSMGQTRIATSALFQQGVAASADGTSLYGSGGANNLRVARTTLTGTVLVDVANAYTEYGVPLGLPAFNHVSGLMVHNNEVHLLVEQYTNDPYNNQHVLVLDPDTLALRRHYDISAALHEVSDLCVAGDGYVYVAEYPASGAQRLHKYDPATYDYLGPVALPVPIPSIQGITWQDDNFYIMSGPGSGNSKLYRMPTNRAAADVIWAGESHRQGLGAYGNGRLLSATGGGSVNVFDYAAAPASERGWALFAGGRVEAVGLPQRSVWTVGASAVPTSTSVNGGMVSVMPWGGANTTRASLVASGNQNRYALWNRTDGYLSDLTSRLSDERLVRHRFHMLQDGTVKREIARDGIVVASDPGVALMPPASSTNISANVGTSQGSTEPFSGYLQYVYVRGGLQPPEWLAAEQASWELTGFYDASGLAPAPEGPGVTYYTPEGTRLPAKALGWWDGTTVRPATALGHWDGAAVAPLA